MMFYVVVTLFVVGMLISGWLAVRESNAAFDAEYGEDTNHNTEEEWDGD